MINDKPEHQDFVMFQGEKLTHLEIETVIDSFYRKVEVHSTLKIPFKSVYNWPHHINRLTHFWWVRLGGLPYEPFSYNPIQKHYESDFNEQFLEDWLNLFDKTLDHNLSQDKAKIWSNLAHRMGEMLNLRNESLRKLSSSGNLTEID